MTTTSFRSLGQKTVATATGRGARGGSPSLGILLRDKRVVILRFFDRLANLGIQAEDKCSESTDF